MFLVWIGGASFFVAKKEKRKEMEVISGGLVRGLDGGSDPGSLSSISSSWLPSVRGKEETMAMACLCCDPAKSLSPFACYGYVDRMVP